VSVGRDQTTAGQPAGL